MIKNEIKSLSIRIEPRVPDKESDEIKSIVECGLKNIVTRSFSSSDTSYNALISAEYVDENYFRNIKERVHCIVNKLGAPFRLVRYNEEF